MHLRTDARQTEETHICSPPFSPSSTVSVDGYGLCAYSKTCKIDSMYGSIRLGIKKVANINMILEKDLTIICQAVTTAATLCQAVRLEMNHSKANNESMTKSDQSPVTIADYGSQAIICKMLQEQYPNDPVVAEEDAFTLSSPEMKGQIEQVTRHVSNVLPEESSIDQKDIIRWIDHGNGQTSNKRFWTLDPIDGTKGFVRGDQYAICLALIENGIVQLGVIACPSLQIDNCVGSLFVAQKDQGAFRKPIMNKELLLHMERTYVNHKSDSFVQSYEVSHGNHSTQEAVAEALNIRNGTNMDSQAKYCMVANGLAAMYIRLSNYKENIWDHAAGALLVEEAGGIVTDRDGKGLIYTSSKMNENNGVVVSNGVLHDKIISTLKTMDN